VKTLLNKWKLFQNEDSRFLLLTGLKFVGIFTFVALFVYYLVWIVASLNSVYFEARDLGKSIELREALTDSLLSVVVDKLPLGLVLLIMIFFAGVYFGKILLRPFEVIGNYSAKSSEGESVEYNPDLFSDYKLLTRFSEFFFRYLEECKKEKRLKDATIPPTFTRIHGPTFERVFFFHFLLLILIFTIITVFAVVYIIAELRSQLFTILLNTTGKAASEQASLFFLENQSFIFESIIWISVILMIISYLTLAFHLYGKVSGAIFAFFSTMRSFMKGNRNARVHLIGYAQIRPHGRAFNKYLDYIERLCENNENKGN
tara:strand:- start:1298 stop:2245 length:948 start_codon:yes stop_codon:yes gene_type:complete